MSENEYFACKLSLTTYIFKVKDILNSMNTCTELNVYSLQQIRLFRTNFFGMPKNMSLKVLFEDGFLTLSKKIEQVKVSLFGKKPFRLKKE